MSQPTARRTCVGEVCNLPCCCPPIYKVTSERVLYTEWDFYRPCDNPATCAMCCTCWLARSVAREWCCAVGASEAAAERRQAALRVRDRAAAGHERSCFDCCAIPIGRTAHYFDIDIVADIRAHQSCWQLCMNEGSLHLGRLQGGDASHNAKTCAFFNVKFVPEVFAYFDALSYDLSKIDLSAFRQNAMRNDIHASSSAA